MGYSVVLIYFTKNVMVYVNPMYASISVWQSNKIVILAPQQLEFSVK